jgi:uncharacterized Zn-binding protein involved in type VI secretion
MDALGAARMGDEIAHGAGILGMLAGAVVGAVVAAVVVASVAATGGLALVIFAAMIAGGALAANQILKGLKTIFHLPDPTTGVLASGSPNVFTNSRPAARASLDFATKCSGGSFPFVTHPLLLPFVEIQIPIAEGSKTVTINSMPAARLKMQLTCSAFIKTASANVFIGGPTARTEFVWDITGWLETGFTWLGYAALLGGAIFAAIAGAAAFAAFVGVVAACFVGFELLGLLGDMIGPGYRDLFQGVAGMLLILAGPKMVKTPAAVEGEVAAESPISTNGTTGGTNKRGVISEDGYRTNAEHIEANSRSINDINIHKDGIATIKEHLGKPEFLENGEMAANNKVMIERAEAIERGELEPTKTDRDFYAHETRESELMSNGMSYEDAHAQTCKEYGITAEMEKNGAFYTKEAESAWNEQIMKNLGF